MSAIHRGLTVSVTVAEERLEEINTMLEGYREKSKPEKEIYGKLMPSAFFISWLTLPAQWYADKERLPARILLLTSYVGNKNTHIRELVTLLSIPLKAVFSFSTEFPSGDVDDDALVVFLKRKSIRRTFYSGFKFIRTADVPQEKLLEAAIFDFLVVQKQDPGFSQQTPRQVKDKIESYVTQQSDLNWAAKNLKGLTRDKINMLLPLICFGLIMLASLLSLILLLFFDGLFLKIAAWVFPAFLLGMVLLFLFLRKNENNPHIPNETVSDEWVREIVLREKNRVVNEMTVIAPLKKGLIRRIFLAVSLRLISLVAYFTYIPTVHTARWLQMDRGKRLLFIANFDNVSEAYAHDFVDSDNRSRNMAVIFSHAAGFPATKWLVKKGYNHRSEYMKGVRVHQKITQFWYAFNTDLSVENLKTNRKFREGLFKKMEDEEIKQWLLKI